MRVHMHLGAVLLVALALANFVSETDALLSGGMLGVRIRAPASAPGRVCSVPAAGCRQGGLLALVERRGRPLLRLAMSEDPLQSGEKREDDRVEERKTESKEKEDEFAGLDESQKKFKAAAIRKEAMDLDAAAAGLRKNAVEQEQEAAKLRIQAWYCFGFPRISHASSSQTSSDIARCPRIRYRKMLHVSVLICMHTHIHTHTHTHTSKTNC